jgi:TonB-dependent SusC/RagA subfamily outer membrane receptor
MKKFYLLVFIITFCFISVSAQFVRKDQLIIVDGKIRNIKLNSISPNDIESISVSKLPSNKEKESFGVLAENGVISITTKGYLQTDNQKDLIIKPLLLVDGTVYTNSLDSINVSEIESVEVIKGISATKLYGKAGGNGVILVKTKEKASDKKQ